MADTLLLDASTWDLVLDANGNIALASEPYSLAQDAASAIKTFGPGNGQVGECYWDTSTGVPWLQQILGQSPTLALVKAQLVAAAETVGDVASAAVFISAFNGRLLTGQVQVVSASSGETSVAAFTSSFIPTNPLGGGPAQGGGGA